MQPSDIVEVSVPEIWSVDCWFVDLFEAKKVSFNGRDNLLEAQWLPNDLYIPLQTVTLRMAEADKLRHFTVTSTGIPSKSVQVPATAPYEVTTTVVQGLPFTITREDDLQAVSSTLAVHTDSVYDYSTVLPPDPHVYGSITFPAGVDHQGVHVRIFNGGEVPAVSTGAGGVLNLWDGSVEVHPYQYIFYKAYVELAAWYSPEDANGSTDLMDSRPWMPNGPAYSMPIALSNYRRGHEIVVYNDPATPWAVHLQAGYEWNTYYYYVQGYPNSLEGVYYSGIYTPYAPATVDFNPVLAFTVLDKTTNESLSFPADPTRYMLDLSRWESLQTIYLKLSPTRFQHQLEIHTSFGTSYPVQFQTTEGMRWSAGQAVDVTAFRDAAYFLATSKAPMDDGIYWWVYDRTTGEFLTAYLADLRGAHSTDQNLDTDYDLLPDWFEKWVGLDPYYSDTDHDGASDYDELFWLTDPFKPDTDGDGFKDGLELLYGLDPLTPDALPVPQNLWVLRAGSTSILLSWEMTSVADQLNDNGSYHFQYETPTGWADLATAAPVLGSARSANFLGLTPDREYRLRARYEADNQVSAWTEPLPVWTAGAFDFALFAIPVEDRSPFHFDEVLAATGGVNGSAGGGENGGGNGGGEGGNGNGAGNQNGAIDPGPFGSQLPVDDGENPPEDQIPDGVTLMVRTALTQRSKYFAFRQFDTPDADPNGPLHFYLQMEVTGDRLINNTGGGRFGDHYYASEQLKSAGYGKAFRVTYQSQDGQAGVSENSFSSKTEFDFLGRSRFNLVEYESSKNVTQNVSTESGLVTSDSKTEGMRYQNVAFAAANGSLWDGAFWQADNYNLVHSGHSRLTDTENGQVIRDQEATLNGNGSWSGAPIGGWGDGFGYNEPYQTISPTEQRYSSSSEGDYTRATKRLSIEYTTEKLIDDVINEAADFPRKWVVFASMPARSDIANWDLSESTDSLVVQKGYYKFHVRGAHLPTLTWVEEFTPSDGSATERNIRNWAVPSGDNFDSPVFEFKPDIRRRNGTYSVSLLPYSVEVVDKDKKPVQKLKIAKLVEPGVLPSSVVSGILSPELDSDRFYICIRGAATVCVGAVKLQTELNRDPDYNDGSELDLQPDGADLISKSLVLVADKWDDEYQVDGKVDNAKNDRTMKVQVGGRLHISSLKLGDNEIATAIRLPVPVEKTLKVKYFNCTYGIASKTPVYTPARLENQMHRVEERFAQCGIQVEFVLAAGTDLGVTSSFHAMGSYFEPSGLEHHITMSTDCKALFTSLPVAADEVGMYAVGYFENHQGTGGLTCVPKYMYPADIASGYGSRCLVSVNNASSVTSAHELMHVLLNAEHEDYPLEFSQTHPEMLWRPTVWVPSILDMKRISLGQALDILGSSSVPAKSSFLK